jgi:T-complex protein 1 subunit delta
MGASNVDLRDVRIVKKVGGTIEDTELVPGVVLNQNFITSQNGPTRMEKAKIALIQFQLSPPKPDVRHSLLTPISTPSPKYLILVCVDGSHRYC